MLKRLACVGLLAALGLPLGACSRPWQDAYLTDSLHKTTQQDVTERLGPPHGVKESLLDGNSTWTYRYALSDRDLNPYSWKNIGKGVTGLGDAAASLIGKGGKQENESLSCARYVLTFDPKKVLQEYKRESC